MLYTSSRNPLAHQKAPTIFPRTKFVACWQPYETSPDGEVGIFFADRLWRPEDGRLETPAEFKTRVRNDLSASRVDLEANYGGTITTFAFPLGNETGIEGANNYPEGASITEHEASTLYDLGFLQNNNQQYTFNYPEYRGFIARRIHVDYDWDGVRLLKEIQQGLPKDIPFEDDFTSNKGWIPAWGNLDLGRNNLSLQASENTSSASTFLDGGALWDNYTFDATVNWDEGSVLILADVLHSKTYHSCAFSDGEVRLQETKDGETHVLATKKSSAITYSDSARMGIRVHGSVIECTWDYASQIEAYTRTTHGGIGIQVWDPELGNASVQVSNVLVRPYEGSDTKPDDTS